MKKYNYMILAVVAALLVVSAGCDRDRRAGESEYSGKDKNSGYVGYADKLNLTTEQKGKLIDLQEKLVTEREKNRDEIVKKEFELKRLYLAETPDINAIDKTQDDIKALAEKNIPLFRDFRNNARALLTEEQLKANPYAFMEPDFGRMDGRGFGGDIGFCGGRGPGGHWGDRGEGHHRWWGDRD